MNVDSTSQRPTRGDWLAVFLAEALAGEVVISGHWSGASPNHVLSRLSRLSKDYLLNACLARWSPEEGCYSLLLRMVERYPSRSTTATTDPGATPLHPRNLQRLLLPSEAQGAFRVFIVIAPPTEGVKAVLRTVR